MLEHVHPNAAPLLVEVYEGLKRFDLAMALLSRLHREDPLSRCYSLLQLVVSARRQGADIAIVRLGIDLITESDRSGLFAAITEVHRQWPGELPDERSLQSLWDEAGGAFDAGDLIKAQATVCRLLAWDPRWVPGWCVLGSLHQRRTKQRRPFDLSGNFLVSELPEDVTALQAAADAFRLAAVLDSALLPAWTGFASASLTLGNLQDAGYAASRAVDIDPGDPETHWLLGSALLAAGDQDGAMRAFDDVIALDPTYQPAVHAVAWVQAHRSRTGSGDHD
jgi:tetratricopeptide (TPR) repeat protein